MDEPNYWKATSGEAVYGKPVSADIDADIVIIGGGYTGLSAAYHLAKNYGIKTHLLEANEIGFGCSGRNGGFVSISVGKSDINGWIRDHGIKEAQHILNQGREAVRLVRDLLHAERIEADSTEDGGLEIAHKPNRLVGLERYGRLLADRFGVETEILDKRAVDQHYLISRECFGALLYKEGFALHALRYAQGLAQAAQRRGAILHPHSPVIAWQREGAKHRLQTPKGIVRASQVIIATNGYTPDGLHSALKGRLLPVLSNIIVTRPLNEDERNNVNWRTHFKIWDTRHLLFYFRLLPDERLLFGARGGIYDTDESRKERRAWLERRLGEMFPPLAGIGSDYFWNGWVCVTYDRNPHVGSTDDHTVHYALGYIGTGVALATYCGKLLAARLAGDKSFAPSVLLRKQLPSFPLPNLRRLYQRGMYRWYEFSDRYL